MHVPEQTMVAAWINAETGVGTPNPRRRTVSLA